MNRIFARDVPILLLAICAFDCSIAAAAYPVIEWAQQVGTNRSDESQDVEVDVSGNILTVGSTTGNYAATNNNENDVFISKHDPSGTLLWKRQFGATGLELGQDVDADQVGNVFFSATRGTGSLPALIIDAIIGKYDAAGNLLWATDFATEFADRGLGVAVDSAGDGYLTGGTGGSLLGSINDNQDAFIRKYNGVDGSLLWSRTIASNAFDSANDVSVDSLGNVFIAGSTLGNLGASAGGQDAFISKFDVQGNHVWTKQFGTSQADYISGIDVDNLGNIFFAGTTGGSLFGSHGGAVDAFVGMYKSDGTFQWGQQLGDSRNNQGGDLSVDGNGNVYLATNTFLNSVPASNLGNEDVFVSKLTSEGALLWTTQFGSPFFDQAWGIAATSVGDLYATGRTVGNIGGPNLGDMDAFLVKIVQVPEPSTLSAFVILSLLALWRR